MRDYNACSYDTVASRFVQRAVKFLAAKANDYGCSGSSYWGNAGSDRS